MRVLFIKLKSLINYEVVGKRFYSELCIWFSKQYPRSAALNWSRIHPMQRAADQNCQSTFVVRCKTPLCYSLVDLVRRHRWIASGHRSPLRRDIFCIQTWIHSIGFQWKYNKMYLDSSIQSTSCHDAADCAIMSSLSTHRFGSAYPLVPPEM